MVLEWFGENGRSLPWRPPMLKPRKDGTLDPYRILVSEIMLQQTQVARVVLKYGDFLERFPTCALLARSTLGEVLRVWSGLGYNRRAKHLWECAREIERERNGVFPRDTAELRKLPGIGPSTAAAIASFAFGMDEPMIDTNVRRVLCRIFFRSRLVSDAKLAVFAKSVIPKGRGRAWNWAVMDIGALHCRAIGHSGACPLYVLHGRVRAFRNQAPQSKFLGSRRYYRGEIIRHLVQCGPAGVERRTLSSIISLQNAELQRVLVGLFEDGLVRHVGKNVVLA